MRHTAHRLLFVIAICPFVLSRGAFAQPSFSRSTAPFPVFDAAGDPYAMPFLGGFNVPRPQLVDIDADGDLDLFVQEKTDRIRFFERVQNGASASFVWKSDSFHDLVVGQWYRFADIDADGDFDLLAEESFSYIRFYRNVGNSQTPRYEMAADSLRNVSGEAIFSDRQNIPNISDIDCDGNADLFIGRVDGTVSHYEREGADAGGVPVFAFRQDRFQDIEIVGTVAGKEARSAERHGANTLAFVDIDDDGDEDIFWGDFFEAGLLFLENAGSCAQPAIIEPVSFPGNDPVQTSGYNAPTFGDLNGDGGLDFVVGVLGGAFSASSSSADNLLFYENDLNGSYTLRSRRLLSNIDVGSDSYPVLVDWDGDGDQDLLVSNSIDPAGQTSSRVVLFENTGSKGNPAFREALALDLAPAFNFAPAFGDLDDDGDLDMLMGTWQGPVAYYRNEGSVQAPDYQLVDGAFLPWPGGSNSAPALIDLDDDGDLDAVIGESAGTLNFFRNTGSAGDPAFTLETERLGGIDAGRRSTPVFIDLDGDGAEELVLGTDQNGIHSYRITGSLFDPQFEAFSYFELPAEQRAVPAPGDLDADGDLDVIMGLLEGGLLYFENRTTSSHSAPVDRPGNNPAFSVYPNPFRERTELRVQIEKPTAFQIAVYDVLGRETNLRHEGVWTPPLSVQELDFSMLPSGFYFARINWDSGRVASISLVHRR